VVLTFDDGRRSVLTDGLPIMKRLGLKGIVFLVPGRTPQADARQTNRTDGFLAWNDVTTLVDSGLFDIESHSLTHARVHTSGRVVATLQAAMQLGYDAMDVPLIRVGDRDLLAGDAPAGTPLLESAPRLSEARRFIEEEGARAGAAIGATLPGRFETEDERRAAIRRELVESKAMIEQHTGRPVRHLCYPWHLSGPTAEALAIEAGYETAFCGKVPGTAITRAGGDPRRIARIGEDYVELLPGKGRSSLTTILRRKWTRRFGRR
jgi:peptidoglycan/xylan/chitin deacetylase (PgdA/CDA1 family)